MKAILVLMVLLLVPFAGAAIIKASIYPDYSTMRIASVSPIVRIGNKTAVTTSGARMISAATEKPTVLPPQVYARPVMAKKSVLICPHVIKSYFVKMIPPYSTHSNDCSMIGKSGYVKEYVNALEYRAKQCGLTKKADWENVIETRKDLDLQIEALEAKKPCLEERIEATMNIRKLFDSSASYFDKKQIAADKYYSTWLESIATDTENYCQMMDELVAPLADSCEQINSMCTENGMIYPEKKQEYHSIISNAMNNANKAYAYLDTFYKGLQASIDKFRQEYSESKLECGRPADSGQMQIAVFEPTVPQPKQNIFKRFFSWLFGKA